MSQYLRYAQTLVLSRYPGVAGRQIVAIEVLGSTCTTRRARRLSLRAFAGFYGPVGHPPQMADCFPIATVEIRIDLAVRSCRRCSAGRSAWRNNRSRPPLGAMHLPHSLTRASTFSLQATSPGRRVQASQARENLPENVERVGNCTSRPDPLPGAGKLAARRKPFEKIVVGDAKIVHREPRRAAIRPAAVQGHAAAIVEYIKLSHAFGRREVRLARHRQGCADNIIARQRRKERRVNRDMAFSF